MRFVADLHVHSHYSRATSKDATPESLYLWALYKGVTLVGTGDFTHPGWRAELREKLEPAGDGIYSLREEFRSQQDVLGGSQHELFRGAGVYFMVSGEISTIYQKHGRVRKIHHLILLPSLEQADELSRRLEKIGNLHADGRPILGLDSRQLLEITLEVCPEAVFIPAHIWTPHFSLFGSNSGFNSLEECFEDLTSYIGAVETGLSSDPPMNWRLAALGRLVLVSNSDAHSPRHLAREANLFDVPLSYPAVAKALTSRGPGLLGTIEFFPEEGKYHYDGHRGCQVRWKPAETLAAQGICPVCGRQVTVGVLHRVEELADLPEGTRPPAARPYESLVPLEEVIADVQGVGRSARQVSRRYFNLLYHLGPELVILREVPLEQIAAVGGPLVAEAIRRMRAGEVEVQPGFDGEYGKIMLVHPGERRGGSQAALFGEVGEGLGQPAEEPAKEAPAPPAPPAGSAGRMAGAGEAWPRPAPGGPALEGLNPEQRLAVTAASGPVVVVAGPGTGKTRTLVHRIVHLVGERGVPPERIAAVTFTNRAAQEIRHRADKMLGEQDIAGLTVGTFHRICLDLLRRNAGDAAGRLVVLDEADSREVLREVEDVKARPVRPLQRAIALLKSRGVLPSSPEVPGELRAIYQAYQARLAAYGALDYDDLLLEALRLPRFELQFDHLLVDEFQDVNAVQYQLVKKWAGDGNNLFVIGDPYQAIYGFRGADHRFFTRLQEDFPRGQVAYLSVNYRSTPVILRAATAVMAKAADPGPALELTAVKEKGPRVLQLEVGGELAEGIAVVREISRLVGGATMLQSDGQGTSHPAAALRDREGGVRSFTDIAVFFRTGRQGEFLEECFLKEGLPYRIIGRESFLEDRLVRQALAFFRVVAEPADAFHFFRVLAAGRFRTGRQALTRLRQIVTASRVPAWVAAGQLEDEIQELHDFRQAVENYRGLAGSRPPEELLARWVAENGLEGQEPLLRLLRVAARFPDLPSLLAGVTLAEEADYERTGGKIASPEAVTLMTMHAAKGLEFPVVFVVGVEDGLIPLREGVTAGGSDAERLAEERRIFYVAMTRAMEELILVSARHRTHRGKKVATTPSPFIQDIPPDCLEKRVWNGRAQRNTGGGKQYHQPTLFTGLTL